MAQTEEPLHMPRPAGSPHGRPKGILKNRSTSNVNTDTTANSNASMAAAAVDSSPLEDRPDMLRTVSEREVVLANTMHNAGPRRSTSRGTNSSRRQSAISRNGSGEHSGETSPRLKWDEANLYLAEQEREAAGGRMKIDEPKTPFAGHYDPTADELDSAGIDPGPLLVDEVEKKLATRDHDVPDLDIGGPEIDMQNNDGFNCHHGFRGSERRVSVGTDTEEVNGDEPAGLRHGEESDFVTPAEREKHKRFEALRRKHYEMSSVKDLLAHPESLNEMDEDEDQEMADTPAVPPPPPQA